MNNPVRYIDLLGLWEVTKDGYRTSDKDEITRFVTYLQVENSVLNNNPSDGQIGSFIKGEMSGGRGRLSDGSPLLTGVEMTGYRSGNSTRFYADQSTVDRTWHEVQGDLTPDALDPRTLFQNITRLSYPGGNNPRKYNGEYDYSHVPTNITEYSAIGHDRRYDNLKVTGASGLFTDTRAIGADWTFVSQELKMGLFPGLSTGTRARAVVLGFGLGVAATPKTLFQLAQPQGFTEIMMWHRASSVGVTNEPSK